MTETKQQTILEQLGGLSGLIYSTLPVVVFVPANSLWGLAPAVWTALGVAAAILVWRIARRSPVQPAISGFLGVGVCAFIAYRTGDAKGYFLFGIYTSLVYAAAFVVSILVRWPLVGVVWGYLNGHRNAWRAHKGAVRAYDIATVAWAAVFGARYLVQSQLYDADQTGWLAVARIGMGWPLTGLVLLVTIWAVRRADRLVEPAPDPAELEAAADGPAADASDIDRGA
ncbi:DUF3159 domain-containing protein [Rhodococcus sp. TAF43]|uniref:DUF3159 domain-containing protein n=1 Tax=unclassified Rhodococcus (in: high G+C Gram-positive bacteria) TaxID=192944 RepID=UPI000E0ABD6F|nr:MULTISPECIES: DUF3159 domain-containing protein [unclassified Rhodococcus (in: high G+C Gram-positive bacteria)]QKT11294.1 DUF3159 domain-containing protein [Rhodococcus sp. W8901]RDI31574.1 uncharacterized protein DUF3159 [Rhodococcus sp. AG1013]